MHAALLTSPTNLNQKLTNYEKKCKCAVESEAILFDFITHVESNEGYRISEIYFEVLKLIMDKAEIESFIYELELIEGLSNHEKDIVDEYMEKPNLIIFRSMGDSRERYLKNFDITGYSEHALIEILKKWIADV